MTVTRSPCEVQPTSKPTGMPSRRPSTRGMGPRICTKGNLKWYSRPLASLTSVPLSLVDASEGRDRGRRVLLRVAPEPLADARLPLAHRPAHQDRVGGA